MKTDGLSFDHLPPLRIPLSFFFSAALFGVLAALGFLLAPEALNHRWSGVSLALTHLLMLGFGAQVMLGALFQIMPVVGGQPLPAADRIARPVRLCLGLGTLNLAAAFVWQWPPLFITALALLVAAFGIFGLSFARALIRSGHSGETRRTLRLAALALLLTLLLGAHQALFHGLPQWLHYFPAVTDAHLRWGGLGWVLLLVMGVSLQVIPMFHVTPAFPSWVAHRLAPLIFLTLILGTLIPALATPALALLGGLMMIYAWVALSRLEQRKRKRLDYTVRFWQLALLHLKFIGALLLGLGIGGDPGAAGLAPAILFATGFMLSVILGMLQKILPFLTYLHLQQACADTPLSLLQLPGMQQLLPRQVSGWQWRLHLASLGLLYLALIPALSPWLAPLAALVLGASFVWLARAIWKVRAAYQRALAEIG